MEPTIFTSLIGHCWTRVSLKKKPYPPPHVSSGLPPGLSSVATFEFRPQSARLPVTSVLPTLGCCSGEGAVELEIIGLNVFCQSLSLLLCRELQARTPPRTWDPATSTTLTTGKRRNSITIVMATNIVPQKIVLKSTTKMSLNERWEMHPWKAWYVALAVGSMWWLLLATLRSREGWTVAEICVNPQY